LIDTARHYIQLGWRIVPIPPRQKRPAVLDWPNRVFAAEDIDPAGNIGVMLGDASGIVDIDLDDFEAVRLAPHYLPETPAVFGRPGKRRSHWIYRVSNPQPTRRHQFPDRRAIVEYRSTGAQTVFPPSTHPTGEVIAWDGEPQPAEVDGAALAEAVEELAQAVRDAAQPAAAGNLTFDAYAVRERPETDAKARCMAYLEKLPDAISGQGGHNATFQAAAECFRFGLSSQEAWEVMKWFNALKCKPEWNDRELSHKIKSAAAAVSKDGETGRRLTEDAADPWYVPTEPEQPKPAFRLISLYDLDEENPPESQVLIDGAVRLGDVATLVAPSKSKKSWLVGNLVAAAISGGEWLGRKVTSCRSLLIDGELRDSTLRKRFVKIFEAWGIDRELWKDITFAPLRGNTDAIEDAKKVIRENPGRWGIIVVDPLYTFYPKSEKGKPPFSENDNAAMRRIFDELIQLGTASNAAVFVVHHSTKGSQNEKSIADMGAGAGAIARSVDAHLVMLKHQEKDCFVFDGTVRDFPDLEPKVWKWEYPLFVPTELDPADIVGAKKPKHKDATTWPDFTKPDPVKEFCLHCITPVPVPFYVIQGRAKECGISRDRAKEFLKCGIADGLILEHQAEGRGQGIKYSNTAHSTQNSLISSG
jgi:hypothetical protein